MTIRVKVFVLGLGVVCLAAVSGYAQRKSDAGSPSLADIARELRAQKAKEPKPMLVITNDNLPATKEGDSKSGSSSASPTSQSPAGSGKPGEVHDAKYYRSRLSKLQDRLDTDKRELEVLQQKLGQNQMQYYPDPNKSLLQQYDRKDIDKLTSDIDAKKQTIAGDEKAIEDLNDQLRHEGGDPSWLR